MSRKTTNGAETAPPHVPASAEIIERVLDRGIVIEYRSRIAVGGIDMGVGVDGRYIVTSCDTDLEYSRPLRMPQRKQTDAQQPRFDGPAPILDGVPAPALSTLLLRRHATSRHR